MTPRRTALLTLLKLTDLAVVIACLVLAVAAGVTQFQGNGWLSILEMRVSLRNVLFVAAYLLLWHFVLKVRGLYSSYRLSPASRELRDLVVAVAIATAPLVPLSLAFDFEYVNQHFLLLFPTITLAALGCERRLLRTVAGRLRSMGRNLRDVVIVGDGGVALDTATRLAQREALGYRVVEVLTIAKPADADAVLARLTTILDGQPIDEVFFASPLDGSRPIVRRLIGLCEDMGVTVRVIAQLAPLDWGSATIDTLGGQPVLTISSGPPDSFHLVAKRVIDVAVAGLALFALSPLFLLIAIAVRLDSRGPIFYAQERVGLNRRRFPTYKFRTMTVDADARQAELEHLNEARGPVFKITHDPRVTRVGRFLRRTSLDELPQLVNVLTGDMSLVGPRPLPVRDVSKMDVRWHQRRFSVKPGITCLWQVTRREPEFDAWIRSDMEYIDNWSLALDLKILARTLPAVIAGHGAV